MSDFTNLNAATKAMKLTPQEISLYKRHLENLSGSGKVVNPDGSISTLYQMSFEHEGRTYNIPSVWNGRILEPNAALARAKSEGLEKFPSYATPQEAESRYQQMHRFMDQDVAGYLAKQGGVLGQR